MNEKLTQKQTLPFYIFVIGIFLLMLSPGLLSRGMFFDGMIYTCIARNLSMGMGDFWHLHYTDFMQADFFGLLPLAMYIESFFFRLFSDSFLIEKLYSFSTFFISGILIQALWKQISPQQKNMGWLALLFWISIPLNMWAATNNILENTMMVFVLLSIYLYYLSVQKYASSKYRFALVLLSGICIYAAFLSKGVTALYPLTMPLFYYICTKRIKFSTFWIDTLLLTSVLVLPVLYIYFCHEAGGFFLRSYYSQQIVNSLENIQTVDLRTYIIGRLFMEFIPAFIIALLLQGLFYVKKIRWKLAKDEVLTLFFFFLLGLSGVCPIMISMKQSGFYMLTTFPLFALAFTLYFSPPLALLIKRIQNSANASKSLLIASIILFCIAIGFVVSQYGKIAREKDRLPDVLVIAPLLPSQAQITLSPTLSTDWSLIAYFNRETDCLSISFDTTQKKPYYLMQKGEKLPESMRGYIKLNLPLSYFEIYALSPSTAKNI